MCVPPINSHLPLMQSLAEEEIISTLYFFFFIIPSSCFLTEVFVITIVFSTVPTCSLSLNILSNRPAESAVAVDRALLTDLFGAKARTVAAIVEIKVSAANTLMICWIIYSDNLWHALSKQTSCRN